MASYAVNEVNNSIMTSTAADKVFNTTELPEAILHELEFPTLLLSQRTSKTFAATITTSTKLQRALFLKPPAHPPKTNPMYTNIIWNKIATPEGYNFSVTEHAASGDVVLHFGRKTPLLVEPATGSWRGMHVGVQMTPGRSEVVLRRSAGRYSRSIAARKEVCTLGEALDALVSAAAMGRSWR